MAKEIRIERYVDGSATIATKHAQGGIVYYYAQEIGKDWKGDIYDLTIEEWEKFPDGDGWIERDDDNNDDNDDDNDGDNNMFPLWSEMARLRKD